MWLPTVFPVLYDRSMIVETMAVYNLASDQDVDNKRSGLRMDLWGAPDLTGIVEDLNGLILIICYLLVRYDLNHWKAEYEIEKNEWWEIIRVILWLIVSNAALKSRRRGMLSSPRSAVRRRSLIRRRRAVPCWVWEQYSFHNFGEKRKNRDGSVTGKRNGIQVRFFKKGLSVAERAVGA